MAEPVVSHALGTLRDLLLPEAKFLYGVSSEVKALETQLKEMQCLLADVDGRQHESNTVKNWISEIRKLAYRAEDVIETYAAEVSSTRGNDFIKLLVRVFCSLNGCFTLHQTRSEILDIKSKIARVTESMQHYGIKSIIQGESSVAVDENRRLKRQTYPFETDDCFVGKEDDLKRLVSLIVDDKEQVISVWGMGGLGKTTIAQKVYNHVEIKRLFKSLTWVCITQECQIRSVFEEVFQQLSSQKKEEIVHLTNVELIGRLREIQKEKRCLIVLDDLWKTDHWESLKDAFLVAGANSKVLLTTRIENIANVGFPYKLGFLNEDDGLELLKRKAFLQNNMPDFGVEERWPVDQIGKEMVKKCGYLPLAISLLGGVLRSKKSLKEWELVNNNIGAYMYKGEGKLEVDKIHGVLDLSYVDLPSYLKPCFLYMGCFKEDESIAVDDLYMLWIAQGMVSTENQGREESLMDVAESYLSELVSRCIVLVDNEKVVPDRRHRTCQLHDIVRELCLSKGREQDFGIKVIDSQCGNSSILDLNSETRHLNVHFSKEDMETVSEITANHEETEIHLRSLRLHNGWQQIELPNNAINFKKLKLLKALEFKLFRFEGGQLPKGINNLIHLRSLKLQECKVCELPKSIGNLTYLYALDLSGCYNVRVPNVLNKLLRLKHLFLPFCYEEHRGLRLEGPIQLETFVGFNSLLHDSESVSKMKNLRRLEATVHDNESLTSIIAGMNTNSHHLHLSSLYIRDSCEFTSTEEGSNLNKVFTCSHLNLLEIHAPMRKLPEECRTQSIFPTLISLKLCNCKIEDDPMELLGKLRCLETLSLSHNSYLGEEMICHAMGFPKLKSLSLYYLPDLKEWRMEEGAMPILSKLEIGYCHKLEMIPDGLRFITTLQILMICGMDELEKRVSRASRRDDEGGQEEGEDFDEVRHVPSIIIR